MRREGKYINVLILGYGRKKAKSLRVNVGLIKALLMGILSAFITLLSFGVYSLYENKKLSKELAQLKEEKDRLSALLAQEREKNAYLLSFKDKVLELEGKLITIDNFLRKKGIRSVPSGVGGLRSEVDVLDMEYLDFLSREANRFERYLGRIPIGPPVWGKVTSGYGYRRDPFTHRYEFHKGIDIKAPYGTPVRATAEGKVVFAGWKPGYGRVVIIEHAYGFKTVYAHLSKIKVKKGQWVKSGRIIGKVGSTGRSTGPHLHYEVWKNSRAVNPYSYMYVRW